MICTSDNFLYSISFSFLLLPTLVNESTLKGLLKNKAKLHDFVKVIDSGVGPELKHARYSEKLAIESHAFIVCSREAKRNVKTRPNSSSASDEILKSSW